MSHMHRMGFPRETQGIHEQQPWVPLAAVIAQAMAAAKGQGPRAKGQGPRAKGQGPRLFCFNLKQNKKIVSMLSAVHPHL